MTTLAEYMTGKAIDDDVGAVGTNCKAFVGTTSVSDAVMGAYLKAAVKWCDGKIQGLDFVDSAGADEDPPADAVLAVFEWVRARCQIEARGGGAGVARVKTGPNREEEYAGGVGHGGAGAGGLGPAAVAGASAWPYLEQYCDPLMRCSGGS